MKNCPRCGVTKSNDEFHKNKARYDGLQSMCKSCWKMYSRDFQKHKRTTDPKYKEYIKTSNKNYLQQKKENMRTRYANDPVYNLQMRLRARLQDCVSRLDMVKCETSMKLLGCDGQTLKSYLEKKFVEGMTWDNRNLWHIDHIKPCDAFDLSNHDEQNSCFHYTNLQPLWAKDNLQKSNKYEERSETKHSSVSTLVEA